MKPRRGLNRSRISGGRADLGQLCIRCCLGFDLGGVREEVLNSGEREVTHAVCDIEPLIVQSHDRIRRLNRELGLVEEMEWCACRRLKVDTLGYLDTSVCPHRKRHRRKRGAKGSAEVRGVLIVDSS